MGPHRDPYQIPTLPFGPLKHSSIRGCCHIDPLAPWSQGPLYAPLEHLTAPIGKCIHLIEDHQIKVTIKTQYLMGGGYHKGGLPSPLL